MATRTQAQRLARRRRLLRGLGIGVLALALGAAWVWQRTLPLERVAVVGAVHAPEAEVSGLAAVEADSVALFALEPALIADRVQRHPWVRAATVRRLPTGTLRIGVRERTPVALVLDGAGRPGHFLDAEGYAMPVAAATPALYDVPVVRGAPAYHPTQPVESAGLRSLLAALAAADAPTQALVSEIDWGRTVTLWTTPVEGHGSLPVRLGHADHASQLQRLRAFWDQAVLPRPDVRFERVDLRFRGQVVTREQGPAADSTASTPTTS
ncbi:cell division protein FtsQ/DivIB [Rubrivirga sp. IMCC45206]|uniref:cell division protein FtsQ/DivIB n=1 Tax=Rubrivirga sp. IMCC45206 TaxID=3391614 RepID=UPI00398FDB23